MASPTDAGIDLRVVLPPDQFEALAQRVAAVLTESRDDGFVGVEGAAEYLGLSRKAVYHLVERGRLAHTASRTGGSSSTGPSFGPMQSAADDRPHSGT